MNRSRRAVLKRSAGLMTTGVSASIAGCSGAADDGSGSNDGDSGGLDAGYAAFFTLNDWANRVAGDRASFEDPVEVGQLGHGWEPDGNLAADVAATDAFVYLDTPEFAWAQDLAATLEADYDDVSVIDGLDGMGDDLLAWDHDLGADEGHDEEQEENGHDEQEEEHGHEDDHGDAEDQHDPHVWIDPVLATDVVRTIADGFAEADPDNADEYAANADEYTAELNAVNDAFDSIAGNATRDAAVLAGHDSFQYLEARYGFRLRSPVGVSPQNEPSQNEIADTIEFVNDEGIDTVLYDRFQSSTLAETIVENSDATETMPVTSAGGTTAEWNEAGYGYVEQMTAINVPAFERAFGAQ